MREWEDDPGVADRWTITPRVIGNMSDAELAALLDPLARRFLDRRGYLIAEQSIPILRKAVADAVLDASALMAKRAQGDYRPDTVVARFPDWSDEAQNANSITITSLLDGWRAEAESLDRSPSTIDGYSSALRKFVAFIGHDDAARVTGLDVLRYKDHRLLIEKRDPKTVHAGDLAAIKAVFGWAVENKRIAANPAHGVRVPQPKKLKRLGHTDDEALRLLRASLRYEKRPREHTKTAAAKRWAPPLLAFTGARLGEIIQLRREDVFSRGGRWYARITPEAGTQKSHRERDVPIHPQLIEWGFLDFVKAAPGGYLFINATGKADYRGPWQAVKNRVAELSRSVVRRDRLSPCHGWRHRFRTICLRSGVDQEKRRMIQGYRGEGTDELVYGEADGLYEEIIKLPRYEL